MSIKCMLFDLDGVLVDLVETHHKCLNQAIYEIAGIPYIITKEDFPHYNGLPTKTKLAKLTEEKGLASYHYSEIAARKQQLTVRAIYELNQNDYTQQRKCLHQLKENGMTVGICSNSVRETVRAVIKVLKYDECVDFFLSNTDVKRPKPNPEIYLRGMIEAGVGPDETIIVEDSHVGWLAGNKSGGRVIAVKNPTEVKFSLFSEYFL